MHEVFLEQDFIVISKESKESDRAILNQHSRKLFVDEKNNDLLTLSEEEIASFMETNEGKNSNFGLDDRSIFKVRVVEKEGKGKKIESSLRLMHKAIAVLNESGLRREGSEGGADGNGGYVLNDSLSISVESDLFGKKKKMHDSGDIIKGGKNFAKELRLRSMKSANYSSKVSLASTKSEKAKTETGKLQTYFSKLFDEVGEREIISGSGMGSMDSVDSDFTMGYASPAKYKNIHRTPLPSLQPSKFKLAADKKKEEEAGYDVEEVEPEMEEGGQKYNPLVPIYDDGFVLGELNDDEALLQDSVTMPLFNKFLEVDLEIKHTMEKAYQRSQSDSPQSLPATTTTTEGAIVYVENIARSPTQIDTKNKYIYSNDDKNTGWDSISDAEKSRFDIKQEDVWVDTLTNEDKRIDGHLTFTENQERKKGINALMANIKRDLAKHRAAKALKEMTEDNKQGNENNDGSLKARARVTQAIFQKKQASLKISNSKNAMKELVRSWRRKKRRERAIAAKKKQMAAMIDEEEVSQEEKNSSSELELPVEKAQKKRVPKSPTPTPLQHLKRSVAQEPEAVATPLYDTIECKVIGIEGCTVRLLPSMTSKPLFILKKGTRLKITKRSNRVSNRVFVTFDMKVQGAHTYSKKEPPQKISSDEEDDDDDDDNDNDNDNDNDLDDSSTSNAAAAKPSEPVDFTRCVTIKVGGWVSIESKEDKTKILNVTSRDLDNAKVEPFDENDGEESDKGVRLVVVGEVGCQLRCTPELRSDEITILPKGTEVIVMNPDTGYKSYDNKRVHVKTIVKGEREINKKQARVVMGWATLAGPGGYPVLNFLLD